MSKTATRAERDRSAHLRIDCPSCGAPPKVECRDFDGDGDPERFTGHPARVITERETR